jgi:hypothetical protein
MVKQHFLFLLKAVMLKPILKPRAKPDTESETDSDAEPEVTKPESVAKPDDVEPEDDQTEFENINDFKVFYLKNKKKLDDTCTVVLNKTYKIQDYVIRKNYGVLNFRKVGKDVKVSKSEQRLTQLENAVNEMIEVLNQIQARLNMI